MGRVPRGPALLAVAVLFAVAELAQLLPLAVGVDFVPLRHAAHALLAGDSVYGDPMFVYPPTAAVALLPTAAGGEVAAFGCWLISLVAALVLTAVLIARLTTTNRLPYAALAVLALLGGVTAHSGLYPGNLSLLLPPVTVGVLVAFHRGRWTAGCALLAASLLIKPLLAPLILIPLLARRWPALAATMLPAGAVLLAGIALLPGGARFPQVFRHTLAGSNLHGREAVNNLSLRGWAETHHLPHAIGLLAAVAVAVAAIARIRAGSPAAWLGGVLLLATFLAGSISEVNYLFVALAAVLTHLVLAGARRRWALAPGVAVLAVPAGCVAGFLTGPAAVQSWLVAGEILLLAGLLGTHLPARLPRAAATSTG